MSQEMRATLITLAVMVTLMLWVPFLYFVQNRLRAISLKRDRDQNDRTIR